MWMKKSQTPRPQSSFKKQLAKNLDTIITQFHNNDSRSYQNTNRPLSQSQHQNCNNQQMQSQLPDQSQNTSSQQKFSLFQDIKGKANNSKISNMIMVNPHIRMIQDKFSTLAKNGKYSDQQLLKAPPQSQNSQVQTPTTKFKNLSGKKNIHLEGFSYSSRLYATLGDKYSNNNNTYVVKQDAIRSRKSVGTILITKNTTFKDIIEEFNKKRDDNIYTMQRYYDEELQSPVHANEYYQQRQKSLKFTTQSSLNVQVIQTTQGSPRVSTARILHRKQSSKGTQAVALNNFLEQCKPSTVYNSSNSLKQKSKFQGLNVQFLDDQDRQLIKNDTNQKAPISSNIMSNNSLNLESPSSINDDKLCKLILQKQEEKGQDSIDEKQKQFDKQLSKVPQPSPKITEAQEQLQKAYNKLQDQDLFSQIANVWKEESKFEIKQKLKAKKQEIRQFIHSSNKQIAQFKKLRFHLKQRLYKLEKINVANSEKLQEQIFSDKPFQRNGSFIFFKALKNNNINLVIEMLNTCPYYVFDFDQYKHYALHIATIKNQEEMVKLLLDKGADPDSIDIANRPPLFYAIKNKNQKIVKLLVSNLADPWSPKGINYYQMTDDYYINRLIKRARNFYFLIKMAPPEYRRYLRTVEKYKYFDI